MKRIIAIVALLAVVFGQGNIMAGNLQEGLELKARLGYSIGGTREPAVIRCCKH